MRQVGFTEQVRAAELADEQAWQVSFTLQEHHSVPERNEARQDALITGTATEATPSSQSTQNTQITTPEQVYTVV